MGQRILWLSMAGAIGTLARYGLASLIQSMNTSNFSFMLLNLSNVAELRMDLGIGQFYHSKLFRCFESFFGKGGCPNILRLQSG